MGMGIKLGLGLTPREGGGPWLATKSALRAYLAANDGTLNQFSQAEASPAPTIRTQSHPLSGTDADLTVASRYTLGASVFRYEGGGDKLFSTFRRFPSDTFAASGGNLGGGENGSSWQVRFIANSTKVAFRLLGTTLRYRCIVDGRYVVKAGTLTSVNTGTEYIILDFGLKATRTIVIEGEQSTGFDGVYVATGDTVSLAPQSPFRMLALGDSFTASTGAAVFGDGMFPVAAAYLALSDRWLSGVGGTGYVSKGVGSAYYSLPERVSADVTRFRNFGAPDIIFVAAGINDIGLSGIQAAAVSVYDTIRQLAPRALVFVVGPWDTAAPSAPAASYSTTKAAIQTALAGRGGFWFLDPQGQAFTKSDGTHPNAAGHLALGQWLATQVRSAVAV